MLLVMVALKTNTSKINITVCCTEVVLVTWHLTARPETYKEQIFATLHENAAKL